MNREDFEKWVRPYLQYTDLGQGSTVLANYELIKKHFKEIKWDEKDGPIRSHILDENKLIFIPVMAAMGLQGPNQKIVNGYFIFSDESNMYCWFGSKPEEIDKEAWIYYPDTTGWSNDHYWIHRGDSISHMNGGEGWSFQSTES